MEARPVRERCILPLLLAVPLAAGCLAAPSAPSSDLPASPGSTIPPAFGSPTLVGAAGFNSISEVSLEAAPDGTLLACALFAADNQVWSSQDGGATWRTSFPFAQLPAGTITNGDCDVAVGADGTWFAAFSGAAPLAAAGFFYGLPATMFIASSRDHGATWDTRPLTPLPTACPSVYGACTNHRPWLRAVGDKLYLTYGSVVPFALFFQRSDDGAATWSPPVLVAGPEGAYQNGVAGQLDTDAAATRLAVPFSRSGSPGAWFGLATTEDDGATWSTREVAGPLEGRGLLIPSVAWAQGGALTYAVSAMNGTQTDLLILVSQDGGATWPHTLLAGTSVDTDAPNPHVALDAAPDGTVTAGWLDWGASGEDEGWVVRVASLEVDAGPRVLGPWNATEPAGQRSFIEYFGLDHDPAGSVHIAYPIPEMPCPTGGQDCIYHVAGRLGSAAQ